VFLPNQALSFLKLSEQFQAEKSLTDN